MTYPLVGNYGINKEDEQGKGPKISALLVREYLPFPSSWRQEGELSSYLDSHGVLGVEGIDTRALGGILPNVVPKGILSSCDLEVGSLLAKLKQTEIKPLSLPEGNKGP